MNKFMGWSIRSLKHGNKIKDPVTAVRETGLFQDEWYRSQYPDVARASMDPALHYVKFGEKEGRSPNPYFTPNWYKEHVKGARNFDGPALVHYARIGWTKGRAPSKNFSSKLYLEQYPSVRKFGIDPLRFHLERGQFETKTAFPTVLEKELIDEDTKTSHIIEEMRVVAESGLFDEKWYRTYYSDLRYLKDDLLYHFVRHGAYEGRKPNLVFETNWYRDRHQKLIADTNPIVFYAREGWKLGHDPAPVFSAKRYFKDNKHLDISPKENEPLAHYLNSGVFLGCELPCPQEPASAAKPKLKKSAKLPIETHLRTLVDFETVDLAPKSNSYDSSTLRIHWVIPDFAAGGGGHMTIFRMVSYLERMGHKQTIWINNPGAQRTDENGYDDIQKYFQFFSGDVKILDSRFKRASGDAIIATDCWTVWPVQSVSNFKRRFYFVQDFEPSFHPMGAQYLAAEETYKQDIDCICASPWLAQLMTEKYGRWARPFWLAADTELYHPPKKRPENKLPRLAFYSRHFTARRAVELGMLALEVLAKRGVQFHVDFFGAQLNFDEAPFAFKDHGVASPEELAALFQKTDIGVVFSATNYSLVPQEMMACGLPIVELKGESTECIFPGETVSLAEPHPEKIADAIEALLKDEERRKAQAEAAHEWVNGFCWEKSAKLVEAALKSRLLEFGDDTFCASKKSTKKEVKTKASVVIPTLNAGPVLDRVLETVTSQETPWPYEILVIDSGSTDGTLETVAKYPSVKLHKINKKDFNHGGTRNLGAELTSGEFIAFLTHDALPANTRWLRNLVRSLEKHPHAAGAFGKHLPYPEASAFTKRDLTAHFDGFLREPLCVSQETNQKRYDKKDQGWRQFLHFYSDNNSIMRRSIWEKIPYREVKFGEDQVWADDIIAAGYNKVYAVRAVVYHSHDFDPAENQERNMTEAAFFKHFFGYCLVKDEKQLELILERTNMHDEIWAKEHGLDHAELEDRFQQNRARLTGYLEGYRADTEGMF